MKDFFISDDLSVGTKGLVFLGDQVLLYRRDGNTTTYPHYLDVPGGGKENDETPFETFQREVKEEFGLLIAQNNIVYARRYPNTIDVGKFGWYAVAKLDPKSKDDIQFGDEGEKYILMPFEEFLQRDDAWPVYQNRAADYARSESTS